MTKNTLTALVNYLTEKNDDYMMDIKAELEKELNRNAEKAQANRELYAEAHDIVMNGLTMIGTPVTVGELYEEVKDELPDGFSKGKVQYALLHYWADEVVKIEGNPNTYKRA